jgi:hypothetical protein
MISFFVRSGLTYAYYFRLSKKVLNPYFKILYELNKNVDVRNKIISFNASQIPIIYHIEVENYNELKKIVHEITNIINNYINYYKKINIIKECENKNECLNELSQNNHELKTASIKQLKSDINNKRKKAKDYVEKNNLNFKNLEALPDRIYEDITCLVKKQYCLNFVDIITYQKNLETSLWSEFQTLIESLDTTLEEK